jgi:hypothetical protein
MTGSFGVVGRCLPDVRPPLHVQCDRDGG